MGRYYNGDIEGKFWFAVQSSDAAKRFGGQMYEPEFISFYFSEDDLEDIEGEIKRIEDKLGDKLQKIDEYFNTHSSYGDKEMRDIGVTGEMLSDYADLELGKKIRDCVVENGECHFDAEL